MLSVMLNIEECARPRHGPENVGQIPDKGRWPISK